MRLRDRLRDDEAEARSRDRLLGRGRGAEEPLEEPALLRRRNADPGVLDLDDGAAAVDERARDDAPARRRELERVRHEVPDELRESLPVAGDGRDVLDLRHEPDLASARKRRGRLDRVAHDLVEACLAKLQLKPVRVEPRHEEEISDEPLQPLRAAVDDREEPFLLVGQLAGFALADHLEEAHHRRQRGP